MDLLFFFHLVSDFPLISFSEEFLGLVVDEELMLELFSPVFTFFV